MPFVKEIKSGASEEYLEWVIRQIDSDQTGKLAAKELQDREAAKREQIEAFLGFAKQTLPKLPLEFGGSVFFTSTWRPYKEEYSEPLNIPLKMGVAEFRFRRDVSKSGSERVSDVGIVCGENRRLVFNIRKTEIVGGEMPEFRLSNNLDLPPTDAEIDEAVALARGMANMLGTTPTP